MTNANANTGDNGSPLQRDCDSPSNRHLFERASAGWKSMNAEIVQALYAPVAETASTAAMDLEHGTLAATPANTTVVDRPASQTPRTAALVKQRFMKLAEMSPPRLYSLVTDKSESITHQLREQRQRDSDRTRRQQTKQLRRERRQQQRLADSSASRRSPSFSLTDVESKDESEAQSNDESVVGGFMFHVRRYWTYLVGAMSNPYRVLLFLVLDVFLDLMFSLLYLVDVSVSKPLPGQWWLWERSQGIYDICVALSFYNLLSFINRFLFSGKRSFTYFGPLLLIDLMTSIPFIVTLFLQMAYAKELYIPYFLRIWLVNMRVQQALNNATELKLVSIDPLREKITVLIFNLITILYTGACLFQLTEVAGGIDDVNIWTSFYFVVITISTVGYGDITPSTLAGRTVVVGIIMSTLIVLPGLIGQIVQTLSDQKERGSSRLASKFKRYVVVLSSLGNDDALVYLADQVLHAEGGMADFLVFYSANAPSDRVVSLFQRSIYRGRVTFLRGAMTEECLVDAGLPGALACFVVADRAFYDNHRYEDQKIVLKTWLTNLVAPNVPLYVTYLHPEARGLVERVVDEAMCLATATQVFMAYNSLYQGASNLILSLMIQKDVRGKYPSWLEQYADGLGNECYTFPAPSVFLGRTFAELAVYVYEQYQVILMGVNVHSEKLDENVFLLNPGGRHVFAAQDEVVVVSQNAQCVAKLRAISEAQFTATFKQSSPSTTRRTILETLSATSMQLGSPEFPIRAVKPLYESSSEDAVRRFYVAPDEMTIADAELADASSLESKSYCLIIADSYDMSGCVIALRGENLTPRELMPIVVLAPRAPSESEWTFLKQFYSVHYIIGDCLNLKDLRRAEPSKARSVIIMSIESRIAEHHDFTDASTLIVYNHVMDMFERSPVAPVSVELKSRHSVRFTLGYEIMMKYRGLNEDREYFLYAPSFTSGSAFLPDILDSIVVQLWKQPNIYHVINALAGLWDERRDRFIREFLGDRRPARLVSKPVPVEFENRTFGELFRHSVTVDDAIPVALFRNGLGFPAPPFVYTNPLAQTYLFSTDHVFMLTTHY